MIDTPATTMVTLDTQKATPTLPAEQAPTTVATATTKAAPATMAATQATNYSQTRYHSGRTIGSSSYPSYNDGCDGRWQPGQ